MSNQMYGVSQDTVEIGGGKFIQVNLLTAISTGRYLDKIEFGSSDAGKKFLEVAIRESDGKTASRRYFEPAIDGEYVKDEKGLVKSANKLNAIFANFTRVYLGQNYSTGPVESFEAYCSKIAADIKRTPGWNKVELRAKVVLNREGFPTLPGYAPVIEPAGVPLADSKLKIGPYDDVTPDNSKPDAEVSGPTNQEVAVGNEAF